MQIFSRFLRAQLKLKRYKLNLTYCWLLIGMLLSMPAVATDDAGILRNQYSSLQHKLEHNQFQRPLYLDSTESPTKLKGDVYAVVNYAFTQVNASLNAATHGADSWCDVLILHLNTKYCSASIINNLPVIKIGMGKKENTSTSSVYDLQFNYRVVASANNYFQVDTSAETGPLSTKDYRIVLEAIPIDKDHTFLHMTYSYGYGLAGRLAMKVYLATIGRSKVGFTTVNTGPASQTQYIGGVRGVVERNTMRYYLAIDAYLKSLNDAPAIRREQRLINWFNATEQYPTQLREITREAYMQMKHEQIQH